jgi:hypothetical protein
MNIFRIHFRAFRGKGSNLTYEAKMLLTSYNVSIREEEGKHVT